MFEDENNGDREDAGLSSQSIKKKKGMDGWLGD